MAIVAADLILYNSGGSGNTDPNASLGGIISTTALVTNTTANLFDSVSGAEATAGDTEYRGFYVKNTHASLTLQNAVIYISSLTSSASDEFDIALSDEAIDVALETIANESTAPVGPTFSRPTTLGTGLAIGNLAAGSFRGIWIKRTVSAAASAATGDVGTLTVAGDTAA